MRPLACLLAACAALAPAAIATAAPAPAGAPPVDTVALGTPAGEGIEKPATEKPPKVQKGPDDWARPAARRLARELNWPQFARSRWPARPPAGR